MLGRLFHGYKGTSSLESAMDDAHTRNLLYGQSQQIYTLANSPPTSPFGSPTFRPGSFDDRGGLELEEKDIRILIAQDAFGGEEKPTLLFDSRANNSNDFSPKPSQSGPRSPIPVDWHPSHSRSNSESKEAIRNRSSTFSGAPSSWSRPVRDAGTREEAFIECMFGSTTSTKASSTTKMHIMPGKPKVNIVTAVDRRTPRSPDEQNAQHRRTPLLRARTSNMTNSGLHSPVSTLENDATLDVVLVTRIFSVSLPENAQVATKDGEIQAAGSGEGTASQSDRPTSSTDSPKRPKLVERKVPAFAIGLVIYLPRSESRASLGQTRPGSRSAHAHNISSASSSYGSDMQASWSFLDAIPESLASSRSFSDDSDRRIDLIVNNWDVILRALSVLEHAATDVLYGQLQQVLAHVTGPSAKVPKEKSMQRINQRIISITDPSTIARTHSLQEASKHLIRRVTYALRIPRVITGIGLVAGHWSDEARSLYRVCGGKQQFFFLFNLLSAFLGNHTQWLQRLAPDWYRKQYRASSKKTHNAQSLTSRTVIVSDQKAIARRLIFILASLLPGPGGVDGLQKLTDEGQLVPYFSTSSPSGPIMRSESLRRAANRRVRDHRIQAGLPEKILLSTSASSTDSTTAEVVKDRPRNNQMRKDSDAVSIRTTSMLQLPDKDSHVRKTSAGTTSDMGPTPTTPIAYISTNQDSYFPDGAVLDGPGSIASADLARILRRNSSSFGNQTSASSKWGSLVSGISDLWSNRQNSSSDIASMITQSPDAKAADRRADVDGSKAVTMSTNTLQNMVNQLNEQAGTSRLGNVHISARSPTTEEEFQPRARPTASTPKMTVDDEDGVIDVELDFPGFQNFSSDTSYSSPLRQAHKSHASVNRDGAESVRSLRSIPSTSPHAPLLDQVNVAGYLRRYHEDFALHAVKDYPDLLYDIKHSMSLESGPDLGTDTKIENDISDKWTTVCTTLVANTRDFSIRRLTLQRRLQKAERNDETPDGQRQDPKITSLAERRSSSQPSGSRVESKFLDEPVKEFDPTLADAIEKALNIASPGPTTATPRSRLGHVRATSSSTTSSAKSVPNIMSGSFPPKELQDSYDYSRQDCRNVVVGALEDVIKSVNDDLSRQQQTQDRPSAQNFDGSRVKIEQKEENVLREGVRQWLLNVEQTRVW